MKEGLSRDLNTAEVLRWKMPGESTFRTSPSMFLLSEIRIGNFMLGQVQKEREKVKRGGDGTRQLKTAHCGNRI